MRVLRFYLGVFFMTASVLMLQIIQTRILSVVSWYYLAFFVISLAMFGITAGTVWVYGRRHRFSEKTLAHDLTYFSSAFAVTNALCVAVQMTLAPAATGMATDFVVALELATCLAIPFFFSGVVVSLALTRSPLPIGRVYAVDLAGAAVGCLGVLLLLNLTDGPSALLWVSVAAALAAACFAGSGFGDVPRSRMPFAGLLLQAKPILVVLVLCAIANGLTGKGLQPMFVKGNLEATEAAPIFVKWNSFSRIAVREGRNKSAMRERDDEPAMWGPSPTFRPVQWSVRQRGMNIDGDAATTTYAFDGDVAHAAFLKYDITNLAHFLPDHRRAAVIGLGGGRDMLSARVFGVPDITGIEINPILMQLLTSAPGYSEFSGLNRLPGMHFHVDEARSWFARTGETFDVIQMSLIDTWAATGAGAFTLSENGLYTVDAWRIFFRRLSPSGVFAVSRWYSPENINETGKIVSLAVATLFDLGVSEPRRHIFLASAGHIATLIVSRSPLSAPDIARLKAVSKEMQYQLLLSPEDTPTSPILRNIVASSTSADLARYTSSLPLDFSPPTDERPFFFNQLPLYDLRKTVNFALSNRADGIASGNLTATLTLVRAFVTSLLLVIITILYPLQPAIADVGRRLASGGTAYFLLIGAGFMSVEIGLLQRMSVFLGHPIYSLSIVLFSLILATGLGSLISDRLPLTSRRRFVSWSLITAGYLACIPFWLPPLLLAFDGAGLLTRASLCVATIAPAGLLMGYGFPTGMRLVSAVDRTPTPWFWGINGAAGVLASSFGVACSIAFGIYVTLMAGALCYVLLIPAAIILQSRDKHTMLPQSA